MAKNKNKNKNKRKNKIKSKKKRLDINKLKAVADAPLIESSSKNNLNMTESPSINQFPWLPGKELGNFKGGRRLKRNWLGLENPSSFSSGFYSIPKFL